MSMENIIGKVTTFVSWVLIVWGTFGLGFAIPIAYMLFSGRVKPGEPYYVDDLAPTHEHAVMQLCIFGGMLLFGFSARAFVKRKQLITTRSGPTPAARP